MAAEDDAADAGGGGDESQPAEPVEAFAEEDSGGNGEQDGHGADHERGVADGGARQAVKLKQELDGDAEQGREQENAQIGTLPAAAAQKGGGQHAEAGKEKSVEHHVGDGHLA